MIYRIAKLAVVLAAFVLFVVGCGGGSGTIPGVPTPIDITPIPVDPNSQTLKFEIITVPALPGGKATASSPVAKVMGALELTETLLGENGRGFLTLYKGREYQIDIFKTPSDQTPVSSKKLTLYVDGSDTFSYVPRGNINGQAKNQVGAPLAGVAIFTSQSYPTFQASAQTYLTYNLDPNGSYSFENVPAGDCWVGIFNSAQDYVNDPNHPVGSINGVVVEGTTTTLGNIIAGVVPTPVPTALPTATPTQTPFPPTPTNTPPPGSTPTNTPIPPTPTNTPVGPTPTFTPIPPTPTFTPTPTNTPVAGNPSITSVTNSATGGSLAKDGDTLTIAGNNFGSSQGTVSINGVNAGITSWGTISITCTVSVGSFKNNGPIVPMSITRTDSQSASFDKMALYSFNTGDIQNLTGIAVPTDVTFDMSGNYYYISDYGNNNIKGFNFATKTQSYNGAAMMGPAAYIDFCPSNSCIYGSVGSRIYKFTSDLSSFTTFGLGTYGAADGVSWNSALGRILIVDYNAFGSMVYSNNLDGSSITTFLDQATLNMPGRVLHCDSSSNVFVASADNDTIKKFASTGTFQYSFTQRSPKSLTSSISGINTILFCPALTSSGTDCLAVYICNNSNANKIGEIAFPGYTLTGSDFYNHNLLICSTNPKAILLIKL